MDIITKLRGVDLEAIIGADWLTIISDVNGYQTEVVNHDYIPAIGSETMDDTSAIMDEMGNYPQIPNPEYIPAVGTPTISNPEPREIFLGRLGMKIQLQELAKPLKNKAIQVAQATASAQIDSMINAAAEKAIIEVVEGAVTTS